jgi:hypothetical protein
MKCTDKPEFVISDQSAYTIKLPEPSDWVCYLFGSKPGGNGLVYYPRKDSVPNGFVRWMMWLCFDCTWIKRV